MLDSKNRKSLYFMAGLPRSGSTLLSSLLNQNPRFYSGPSSPVTGLMMLLQDQILNDELYRAFPKPQQASEMVASVIQHYYSDVDKPVIFDKNRSWVNRLGFISGFFGVEPRVLIPVRDTAEILTSFIMMHRRNPYEVNGRINFLDEMLVKSNIPLTDDNRCQFLASQAGSLGQSYAGIQQALMEGRQSQMHFIEYTDLMTNPAEAMRRIYEFLDEPYFEHDFEQITNIHRENDAEIYGFADMHDVRKALGKTSADPRDILSPEILKACEGTEFWRNLGPIDPAGNMPNNSIVPSNGIMPTSDSGFFGSVDSADTKIIGG